MILSEVMQIFAYWASHPPVHLLAGAWLGIGRKRRPPRPSEANSVLAGLGAGFDAGDVHAGLPAPELDFDRLKR